MIAKNTGRYIASIIGSVMTRISLSPFRAKIDGIHMIIDLEHSIDTKFFLKRSYETLDTDYLLSFVNQGMTAVDVGANIGIISLKLAQKIGKRGHVFAFEPSWWTFDRLSQNIKLNGFSNVTAENAAVGLETSDGVEIDLPQGYRLDGRNTAKKQTVKIWSLDDYLSGKKIDILKIDTDGYESNILEGAKNTISTYKPIIMFEFGPDHAKKQGFEPMAPFDFMEKYGYIFKLNTGCIADPVELMQRIKPFGSVNVFAIQNS